MTERKRGKNGRFEKKEETTTRDAGLGNVRPGKSPEAPRPRNCRVYVRARLAAALPRIVRRLLRQAAAGSVPHTALLLKAAGLDSRNELVPPARKRPEKSIGELLLEEWDQKRVN